MTNQNIRTGSSKVISAVEPGVISFQYTDQWSVFDRGSSPQTIPGIGIARCACAVKSFSFPKRIGIPTHFIEQTSPTTIHVQEFSVPGLPSLSGKAEGYVLDAEWIWRAYVAGSLLERINSGKVNPVDLGFAEGTKVVRGMKLPRLVHECTTKFESVDRPMDDDETRARLGFTIHQWEHAWNVIGNAVEASNNHFEEDGFYCPDGKLEVGMNDQGEIVIVDVFGTQDENRIVESSTGEFFSKDLIRDYLKGLPWKSDLDSAKKSHPTNKSKWPQYPLLPDSLVELVSTRYAEVARRYAGAKL